jgi:hypothetical protein
MPAKKNHSFEEIRRHLDGIEEEIRLGRESIKAGDRQRFLQHHRRFKKLLAEYVKAASQLEGTSLKELEDRFRSLPWIPIGPAVCGLGAVARTVDSAASAWILLG